MLFNFSVIMVDEAHERTFSTDVLFGLVKVKSVAKICVKYIIYQTWISPRKKSRSDDQILIANLEWFS